MSKQKKVRTLPDFLIIGAQKCGTTSLFHYLIQHPQILAPNEKELHFFDLYYENGFDWYKSQFPPKPVNGRKVLSGEATPKYIYEENVPQLVFQHMPNVKLIVLLRNPVDRAYSHYQMELKNQHPELICEGGDIVTFAEALERDFDGIVTRGLYAEQLKRWFKLFPRNQILVLQSEQFFTEPERVLQRVFHFLGLPAIKLTHYEPLLKGDYDEMPPDESLKLSAYYRPYNLRLYQLLKQNFLWN
ncbi:sulfotransferase domain-containing protein [Bacillus rubiinfantis]|uniref:sulfotransferase domain-containing protein n=1 Tax=Bacillus rubiinfantis TaxID=1499680 RepID=UPI0005AA39E5|nr:sulfotransferase domain-containing protein [Bacillus rubiinfantis]